MNIEEIKKAAVAEIGAAADPEELERLRLKYLGRKGEVMAVLRGVKDLPLEERRTAGPQARALQEELEGLIAAKLKAAPAASAYPGLDLTAPGKAPVRGHLNPLTLVEQEIRRIFTGLNFSVMDGPEAESEYYNFDALNIPAGHPARDMWDTFWLKGAKREQGKKDRDRAALLRTHTSPMQVRYMEKHEPPFQIIVPGRCFRYEAIDASHEINFHQFEGLMVGKDVNLANFKFIIEEFFRQFFREDVEFRYRPSYFPFVEPGLEVDIKLKGKWLEVMGAGMVHQRVFEYAHYNPGDWQGFAFGAGIDRLAMIKYGIPDIRMFYSGDLRVIKQFS